MRQADDECREEAERLSQLPKAEQRTIVALHWSVAKDKDVSDANRKEARRRAVALERLLRLKPKKTSPKSSQKP